MQRSMPLLERLTACCEDPRACDLDIISHPDNECRWRFKP